MIKFRPKNEKIVFQKQKFQSKNAKYKISFLKDPNERAKIVHLMSNLVKIDFQRVTYWYV